MVSLQGDVAFLRSSPITVGVRGGRSQAKNVSAEAKRRAERDNRRRPWSGVFQLLCNCILRAFCFGSITCKGSALSVIIIQALAMCTVFLSAASETISLRGSGLAVHSTWSFSHGNQCMHCRNSLQLLSKCCYTMYGVWCI
jgi:hypothetical protein